MQTQDNREGQMTHICGQTHRGLSIRQFQSGFWCRILPIILLWPVAGSAASSHEDAPTTNYMIVVTGSELLKGDYADGHTHFLTRTMHPLGLRCIGSMSVDDQPDDIKEALQFATGKADLVFVTGGLGPTDSDITRQTLAAFTGITLHEHPDVLHKLEERYDTPQDQLRPGLRRQTLVPTAGTYLRNAKGSAVGLVFESASSVIAALPGPPRELQPMVRNELLKYLGQRFDLRPAGCSLTLRFVGIGQSSIQQTLKEHIPLPPNTVPSSQFRNGRVDFSFSLPEDTPRHRKQLQQLQQKIIHHLGDYIYATDDSSLEDHVVGLLESRNQTLAIAEVGTGGSLTSQISSASGADNVFSGAFVAPTEGKLRTLLGTSGDDPAEQTSGAEAAEQLAAAAARFTSSNWTCAIGQIQTDESGAIFVHVAVRTPEAHVQTQYVRLRAGDTRHSRLVTQLLNQLRQQLR
ncbi:MAG: molybdopterin-binding protein [Fuerstiella sp.]|nr:molybdopterin-binding protein [Fuerstiella sp.]